jgi:hypothetical protein
MKGPWKWSESGLQLIDNGGRTVLLIRPSDATEEEFNVIEAAPELAFMLAEMLLEAVGRAGGVSDVTARKAQDLLARIK